MNMIYNAGIHHCNESLVFKNPQGESEVFHLSLWKELSMPSDPTIMPELSLSFDTGMDLMDQEPLFNGTDDIEELFDGIQLTYDDDDEPAMDDDCIIVKHQNQPSKPEASIVRYNANKPFITPLSRSVSINDSDNEEETKIKIQSIKKRRREDTEDSITTEPQDQLTTPEPTLIVCNGFTRSPSAMTSQSDSTNVLNNENETEFDTKTPRKRQRREENHTDNAMEYWGNILSYVAKLPDYLTKVNNTISMIRPRDSATSENPSHSNKPPVLYTKNDITKWIWICGQNGEKTELQGRITTCVFLMSLWYDINVSDGQVVDRVCQTEGIRRTMELSNGVTMLGEMTNENIVKENQWLGKRIMRHIVEFGWSILFWDEIKTAMLRRKPAAELNELWRYMGNNTPNCDRFLHAEMATHISNDAAMEKIVELVGYTCGSVEMARVLVERLNSVDKVMIMS
jgi:hypothetical protein